ncbi:ABC transporter permease [Neolewinella lacunae]|uniref:ABC transporter permease n=1 Tax=Neolewinella lacunae TaxID=1517758 RepID=A0A923PL32_9BACT|nr:ABC transporter permease [Neolewinella lacunae]MBC6993183.1 ABC transporter permease [Neolewinella lacunae]MDN3637102.1 ABC transporter permease [Neolewinella lacunae]
MFRAFTESFQRLRSNFFQTFLSVLGVIIGVGALVAMLSMIDGLEAYARETIAARTSLENLFVSSKLGEQVDGIYVPRDTVAVLDEAVAAELLDSLPYPARVQLQFSVPTLGYGPDSARLGIYCSAIGLPLLTPPAEDFLLHGRFLAGEDAAGAARVALVNDQLARRLLAPTDSLEVALGRQVYLFGDSLSIVGIFAAEKGDSNLALATTLPSLRGLQDPPAIYPELMLALENVHHVLDAQRFTDGWMARRFKNIPEATETRTYSGYLKELEKGMLVFRLVMGFLIGIAVVVGGVGVMNVLLMSIAERTPEIGIRKAVGANRGNIVREFLAESVAISAIGCFFGVLLGMGVALLAAPVLNYFMEEVQFRAIFSLRTMLIVCVVALLIGIIFGTYPARKAAGLDPVVAIQR